MKFGDILALAKSGFTYTNIKELMAMDTDGTQELVVEDATPGITDISPMDTGASATPAPAPEPEKASPDYGEEIQKLVKEDKGTLNISEYLYVCDKCENIDVIPCLDYKIRVAKKFDETQEFANIDERYKAYREFINSMPVEVIEYKHYCKKCRNQLRKIEHPDKEELHCPSCHKVLRATSIGVS